MNEQIDRILLKLKEVRKQGLKGFGSKNQGFRLNPTLSESTLVEFENKHHIRLPEAYRQFLLRGGNGGCGPYYGLLSLEQWDEAADVTPEELESYLSQPCPLYPGMSRKKTWETELGCSYEERYQGAIAITHLGCAYYALLIVSGEAKGRIVYVDLDDQPPYFPENPDFLSWYERWLDELLAGYDMAWFGCGMPGTESDLLCKGQRHGAVHFNYISHIRLAYSFGDSPGMPIP